VRYNLTRNTCIDSTNECCSANSMLRTACFVILMRNVLQYNHFCRATLCIVRDLCRRAVSVRLSLCYIVSKRNVLKLIPPSRICRPTIISLHTKRYGNSDSLPLTGALNAGVVWKIVIFNQYLALSRKWHKIGA